MHCSGRPSLPPFLAAGQPQVGDDGLYSARHKFRRQKCQICSPSPPPLGMAAAKSTQHSSPHVGTAHIKESDHRAPNGAGGGGSSSSSSALPEPWPPLWVPPCCCCGGCWPSAGAPSAAGCCCCCCAASAACACASAGPPLLTSSTGSSAQPAGLCSEWHPGQARPLQQLLNPMSANNGLKGSYAGHQICWSPRYAQRQHPAHMCTQLPTFPLATYLATSGPSARQSRPGRRGAPAASAGQPARSRTSPAEWKDEGTLQLCTRRSLRTHRRPGGGPCTHKTSNKERKGKHSKT